MAEWKKGSLGMRNDAERVLEWQAGDEVALAILDIDPVAQVDDASLHVTADAVTGIPQCGPAHSIQIIKLATVRVEQLINAVAKMEEVPGH